ncbi:MAG: ATP-binding cassette domain-containing protein [Pedobacter sp.]|nr:ATP-binding cassette domain-containing protein [Pedobacter sp.]MDQ8053997.1 ATP-binding cassette domain-containing protein [Pedobacter sp.]
MQELYIDSVHHRFGDREVLSSVFLNCKVGEIVGVLGRNGSGKSTLLKIIFGELRPRFMHLKVDGTVVNKGYLTREVAYLPQAYFIPYYLKIDQLIALFSNRYREQLLEINVVRSNLTEKLGNLSGGSRRFVEALLIIYSDAKYVLLDEPFSQMAPMMVDDLKAHIRKFSVEKGFVITDHYYREILDISSRIVLIHNGCNYAINHNDDLIVHGYLPD